MELSAEIHQSLKEAEEEFEIIKQEVEDVTSSAFTGRRRDSEKDRERLSLVANVGRLGEDLKLQVLLFSANSTFLTRLLEHVFNSARPNCRRSATLRL